MHTTIRSLRSVRGSAVTIAWLNRSRDRSREARYISSSSIDDLILNMLGLARIGIVEQKGATSQGICLGIGGSGSSCPLNSNLELPLDGAGGEASDIVLDKERVDQSHRDRPEQRRRHQLAPVEHVTADQLGDHHDGNRAD
jgi:hypothetical protein